MDMKCNSCGALNPAINRYCGQCGRRLEQVAADASGKFSLESRTRASGAAESSDDVPPYIINLNRQSSPPSGQGAENLEREGETNDETQLSETPQLPGQLRIVYENAKTGGSGPSLPGLSDDSAPEYYDDEGEPQSHLWRNIALCALGVAVILAALQWRSIRHYGARQLGWDFGQEHSLNAGQRETVAPNPAATATDNTKITQGVNAAATKTGALEARPSANYGQSVALPGNSSNSASRSAAPGTAVNAAAPHAMGVPLREVPENQSQGMVGQRNIASPSGNARREHMTQGAAPGNDEMNRAAKSGSAEERAMWLWKAVGKGNSEAPVALARMYEQGSGVVQSCDQAQILLRTAAAKGNEEARANLRQIRLQGGCAPR